MPLDAVTNILQTRATKVAEVKAGGWSQEALESLNDQFHKEVGKNLLDIAGADGLRKLWMEQVLSVSGEPLLEKRLNLYNKAFEALQLRVAAGMIGGVAGEEVRFNAEGAWRNKNSPAAPGPTPVSARAAGVEVLRIGPGEKDLGAVVERENRQVIVALGTAIERDLRDATVSLLDHGLNVNEQFAASGGRDFPLNIAMSHNHFELAERLLTDYRAEATVYAVALAIYHRHLGLFNVLMEMRFDVNQRVPDNILQGTRNTLLGVAVLREFREAVFALLDKGAIPDKSTLEYAVESSNLDLLKKLAKKKPKEMSLMEALNVAVVRNKISMVRLLNHELFPSLPTET